MPIWKFYIHIHAYTIYIHIIHWPYMYRSLVQTETYIYNNIKCESTATIHKHIGTYYLYNMNTENRFLVIEMSNEGILPCGLTCAYQIPCLPKTFTIIRWITHILPFEILPKVVQQHPYTYKNHIFSIHI